LPPRRLRRALRGGGGTAPDDVGRPPHAADRPARAVRPPALPRPRPAACRGLDLPADRHRAPLDRAPSAARGLVDPRASPRRVATTGVPAPPCPMRTPRPAAPLH